MFKKNQFSKKNKMVQGLVIFQVRPQDSPHALKTYLYLMFLSKLVFESFLTIAKK